MVTLSESNLLLIDKPKGITSFDVIRILRKELNIQKMGHAGTLDPFATGLLILGINDGTKKLTELVGLSKTYEGEILLGKKTDTGDITGIVIEKKEVLVISKEEIERVAKEMIGTHNLPVPLYSAIKKNGKPLYEYARSGTPVEVPIKQMTVVNCHIKSIELPIIKVFFDVSSGSYIRTLSELFAEKLGTVGTLVNLRRFSVGDYQVENAQQIDSIEYILNKK